MIKKKKAVKFLQKDTIFPSLAFDYFLVTFRSREDSISFLFIATIHIVTRSLHVKLDKAVVRIIREQAVAPNEGSNGEAVVNPSSLSIIRDEG